MKPLRLALTLLMSVLSLRAQLSLPKSPFLLNRSNLCG
jgi:hypothetical protein